MNTRKMFALFLVLALTGSALAMQQQRLYKSDGGDPQAEGVIAVQQHSVFVEIIVEEQEEVRQIHQFAAVVGLVKKCKQVRNVFDNAVLWFNDQFLFGNKSNQTINVTPSDTNISMGYNPNRTAGMNATEREAFWNESLNDQNRIGGSYTYNSSSQLPESNGDETANVTNAGGNPDRDGFIRANDFRERWGGCFIPNGFVHAIGADDPYGTGVANDAPVVDSIGITKELIDLDHECDGCIFDYIGTFYITDPNNHRWMIDKFTYPIDLADTLGFAGVAGSADGPGSDDPTNCHVGGFLLTGSACGADTETHSDRQEDDGIADNEVFDDGECGPERPPDPEPGVADECGDGGGDDTNTTNSNPSANESDHAQGSETSNGNENFDNHCYDGPDGECTADQSDHTDVRHTGCEVAGHDQLNTNECVFYPTKVTTKEPLYTVHIQVDPWNPYRQGFADEAIWAYEDGTRRLGAPYADDPAKHSNYDLCKSGTVNDDVLDFDPDDQMGSTDDPKEPTRGTAGTHVECAIEYNFLIAVDFEAFDDLHPSDPDAGIVGEGEIIREGKEYGQGGADSSDKWWQGNSGPHNPYRCENVYSNGTPANDSHNFDEDGLAGQDPTAHCYRNQTSQPEPKERLDVLALDLFFYANAPVFVVENPYWNYVNGDPSETTGTPPIVDSYCETAIAEAAPHQVSAVAARSPIVCDVDAMDGFRLHDGSQTIP